MGALQQYLDLYSANSGLLCQGLPRAVNDARSRAFSLLSQPGVELPGRVEGHEHTSLDRLYAPDYGLNLGRVDIYGADTEAARAFKCGAGVLTPWIITVANDIVLKPEFPKGRALPEGVVFAPLREAPGQVLDKWYGSCVPASNVEAQLNTMLVRDGIVVYVPDGMKLERPLQIVNLCSAAVNQMAVRRVLVVAGEGASVSLLLCDHAATSRGNSSLCSQVVEVVVGKGASVSVYDLEESGPENSRNWLLFARQQAHSALHVNVDTLLCGVTRNDIDVSLMGEHCETRLSGMVVGSAHMRVDTDTHLVHAHPRCHSEQLFKYVLDDEAVGSFEGRVVVAPGAVKTDARQTNRNILASYGAKMHTKPQLEIYNDDVKCSHGATTGQLDQAALFYMQARGIPLKEARTMLMQAFLMDVVDGVGIESLRQRIRHMVERRFSGEEMCASCLDAGKIPAATDIDDDGR